MQIDYVTFRERADRSRYIAHRFGKYLKESVLDVGCDKALLRTLLPSEVRYTGVDVGGTPDITLDLDVAGKLPFADRSFATTVCSDVLEHLDNLHVIFAELERVSQKYIVVSLPNNWANARRPIERGYGAIAHYGLPSTRPSDRHKWFFGFTEALAFLEAQARAPTLSLVEVIANDKPRMALLRAARRARYPGHRYLNRYAHTVWAVYRRSA